MRRQKLDPLSVLRAMRMQMPVVTRAQPLAAIPVHEISAFDAVHAHLQQSKLLPLLSTTHTIVCITDELIRQHYPGIDPLAGGMAPIDAFIYVYEGMTEHERRRAWAKGDVSQFLGETGFRELLVELTRACRIHHFCSLNLRGDTVVTEPITKKPTIEARKEAFAVTARARVAFQQMAGKIEKEIAATGDDTPPVYRDAHQFARAMQNDLAPLASIGKQLRAS
jgi:hypothetical protein